MDVTKTFPFVTGVVSLLQVPVWSRYYRYWCGIVTAGAGAALLPHAPQACVFTSVMIINCLTPSVGNIVDLRQCYCLFLNQKCTQCI